VADQLGGAPWRCAGDGRAVLRDDPASRRGAGDALCGDGAVAARQRPIHPPRSGRDARPPERGRRRAVAAWRRAPPDHQGSTLKLSLTLGQAGGYTRPSSPRPIRPTAPTCMDTFPDLGSLTDEELKDLIKELTVQETEISYRRRILHGKIDILRAELVNRLRKKHEGGDVLITGDDVQRLTDILAHRQADPASEDGQR